MCRVLVVDDTPDQRERIQEIIRDFDDRIGVVTARDDLEALTCIEAAEEEQSPFDVAIVDLYLSEPKKLERPEGLIVLADITKRFPDCYRVLISRHIKEKEFPTPAPFVDRFVSFHYAARSYQSQLVDAIRESGEMAGRH